MTVMFKNIAKRSLDDKVNKVRYNANMNKNYIDNIFDDALDSLGIIANSIEEVDFSDSKELSKKIPAYNNYFSDISLVDNKGLKRYGKCMYNQFVGSEAFADALKGRTAINSSITVNADNKKQICMFSPVMKSGTVKGVLIGSMMQDSINNLFNMNIMHENESMCVIGMNGDYICGSDLFFNIAGSSNGNYLNYLKNVDMVNMDKNLYALREEISKGGEFELQYKIDEYMDISVGQALKRNGWYVVSAIRDSNSGSLSKMMSSRNLNLAITMVIDIAIMVGAVIFLANDKHKKEALIDKMETLVKVEGAILFEYTFSPKCFSIFMSYGKFSVTKKNSFVGESVYDIYDYVHEDDISIRSRLRKFFESNDPVFSSEVRIRNVYGNYEWYKITGTLVRDKWGNNISFVGKLTDADKQIAEEKNLVQRAENDLLTGVLNKKTMEEKISELLAIKKNDRYYIFFMIDLDNFKNVNDTLGHIYGDKAICDTANELSEIFKTNAIVGRLGGDEFAVCAIYDAFDEESLSQFIEKKAEAVRLANLRSYSDGVSKVDISSSIGIAVSPNDGSDFETIYKRADRALYESKNSGKNKYTRFGIKLPM